MQLGGRKGIRSVKTWGGYGGGVAVSSVGVAPTWTVGASASIYFLSLLHKTRRFFMMAYNNDIGLDPVGDPHAYVNRRWGNTLTLSASSFWVTATD